jgi:hypothetical protein
MPARHQASPLLRLGSNSARVKVDLRSNNLPGIVEHQTHDHRELDRLACRLPGSLAGPLPDGVVAADHATPFDVPIVDPPFVETVEERCDLVDRSS